MTTAIGVIVLLGGLIFFHELGHYSIAKFFGVRVEVFSLGFGKKIFNKKWGETEYCLSLFPLGGYVKLMGDDPYKEIPADQAHRAFSTQALYKRFAIVAAGPLANLLLAYVLFMIVFWFGLPLPGTTIGNVVAESDAWNAGLRSGDRIVQIGGTGVSNWTEVDDFLKTRAGESTDVVIERDNAQQTVPVQIAEVESKNEYGEDVLVGGIKGIALNPISALIGISDPESPAYQAGLRTGDIVTKIGTEEIAAFDQMDSVIKANWKAKQPLTFTVVRTEASNTTELSFPVATPGKIEPASSTAFGSAEQLGIYPSEMFVKVITPESPAEKGDLQPGDRIVALSGKAVYNFDTIVDYVQEAGKKGEPVVLTLQRGGQTVKKELTPTSTTREDPRTRETIHQYIIGFQPFLSYQPAEMTKQVIRSPIELVTKAVTETNSLASRMLISLGKLVAGQISVKNLGGPVLIASVAGKSLDAGIIPFLQMMALISINLFLLNLFPIPILDGGHLLFFTIEAIQRKPVSIRTMEIANQVGMVFILMLVGLTLFNDISRMVVH